MIEKIKTMAVLLLLAFNVVTANAQTTSTNFNWDNVMNAIIQVESGDNPNAKNGKCVGAMQISPVLVTECNNILKRRKSTKRYTLADRYSIEKSKEMFILMQSEFNKTNSIERAIKSWNGGPYYKNGTKVQRYYQKVMRKMK